MDVRIPPEVDAPGAVLYRRASVLVGDVDTKQGKVHGQVVPYDERVELVPGVYEEFAPGTFARQVASPDTWGRVKLLIGHDRGAVPLGRAEKMADSRTGLAVDFQMNMRMISETERGREAWLALDNGDLDEFSVGFRSVSRGGTEKKHLRMGEVLLRRLRAHLAEVSLVPYGAYGRSAAVASVRSGLLSLDEVRRMEADPWEAERSRLDLYRRNLRP